MSTSTIRRCNAPTTNCEHESPPTPTTPSGRKLTTSLDPEGAHLAALRRLANFASASVLEVGCGDGRLSLGIAEQAATVLAFDPDEDAIKEAQATLPRQLTGRISYRAASATTIEIPRSEHDIVVFSWSL